MKSSIITAVEAWEALSDYMVPSVNVTVTTAGGKRASASYTEGISKSSYYGYHLYDGGNRFNGKGVSAAAALINTALAPVLVGMDSQKQGRIDEIIMETLAAGGTPAAVNVSSPVSFAVLKAGAASLGVPLFAYIGGSFSAKIPVPGFLCASGSNRYGDHSAAMGKPNYAFVAYNFHSNDEADYALWEVETLWENSMAKEYGVRPHRGFSMAIPKGRVKNDGQLWELMTRCIETAGFAGKVGLHADFSASAFYNPASARYEGLYDEKPRSREEMISLVTESVKKYPFVIVQDPLEPNDTGGFKEITGAVDIQVAGSDIFGSDLKRLRECAVNGCFNTAVLRVQKYATFSECVKAVVICDQLGIGVMPWDSTGEDWDIIHYAAGFRCGSVCMSGLSSHGNKMALIENEIGPRASFFGPQGLKGRRFSLGEVK
jgi:enolase